MNGAQEASVKTSADPAVSVATLPSWQLFALAGLVGATIVVFVSRGQSPSAIILLSLVVFAAAGVGAAALRTLVPFVRGYEGLSVAIAGGRARAAIDREKTLVLRSIKELEFDHAMGKVSDQDFAEMGLRLRTRAAGLIRQLDAGAGYRAQIERDLAKRLGQAPAPRDAASVQSSTPVAACGSCATVNDADARFCKNCGSQL